MRKTVLTFFGKQAIQNLLALYGVQLANYILPFLTLPYLANVLGATGWGSLAIVQSLSQYLNLLVEYGFALSATREVARNQGQRRFLSQILADVLGAKLILATIAVLIAVAVARLVPNLGEDSMLLGAGVFWAIAAAFSPAWFFQGIERLRLVAALEVASRIAAVALIFMFVRSPSDAWRVLLIQGIGAAIASLISLMMAWREAGFALPSVRSSTRVIWAGGHMFFFRAAVSLYTVGNAFLLGLFVPPQQVAYFAGAERVVKALISLLDPLTRIIFPRLSYLISNSPASASKLSRKAIAFMSMSGIVLAVLVLISAPAITRIVLGSQFEEAIPVLRALALLIPLIAISNALGVQWMLAMKMDQAFNTIILTAGILNLCLALLIVPRFSYMGMAYVVVLVETFVTGGIAVYLWLSGKSPWHLNREVKRSES